MTTKETDSARSKVLSEANKSPFQFNTKSLLLFPAMIVLFVGVYYTLYLLGLIFETSLIGLKDLPGWSILGWGVDDDVPGWLLLMAVTFTLGLTRSTRADVTAWLLSFSCPLADAFLFRNLPLASVLEAGAVQLAGSLLGCMAWFVGWWLRGRKAEPAEATRMNRGRTTGMVSLSVMLFCFSAYGWWELNVNTVQISRPGDPSDFDSIDVLVVPEIATSVRYAVAPDKSLHVAYGLSQKYPATKVIERIAKRLQRLGWEPLQTDWMNPEIPSSHVDGWSDYIDKTRTPSQHIHQWKGQWKDREGNIVDYTFTYSYPYNGTPNLTSLWVNGSWFPAESIAVMPGLH